MPGYKMGMNKTKPKAKPKAKAKPKIKITKEPVVEEPVVEEPVVVIEEKFAENVAAIAVPLFGQ